MTKLTKSQIKALPPGTVRGDGGNLWIASGNTGRKRWEFRYTFAGKRRCMGLGPWPEISLEEARTKAFANRKLLIEGIDPLADKNTHKPLRMTAFREVTMPSEKRSAPGEAKPGDTTAFGPDPLEADPIQSEGVTRVGPVSSLDDIPEVARYLARVGAIAINFRAAVVREDVGGYTADPPRLFYRTHPSRDMRPETFNIRVAPFSHSANTAGLVWRHLACQHERMVYRPDASPGTLSIDGSRCFNVYEGARIEPLEGDEGLWREFLEHLFPDDDERPEVMRWIATLIARPDIRMRYGMLLISIAQGVGKNTLGNILRILLGTRNVSFSEHFRQAARLAGQDHQGAQGRRWRDSLGRQATPEGQRVEASPSDELRSR